MDMKVRKWFILVATGIMILLVNLDMTIVNLALATIAKSMHADMNQTQWVIVSYLLGTALTFTIFGRLADLFGKKNIFLLGVLLFTMASFFAGFSTNLTTLIIARFIQGFGFAATLGLCFVIILSYFPEDQRGLAAGAGVAITGIAQAIGPTSGGAIVEFLSWHWVFFINVPLGILSFILTMIFVPKDQRSMGPKKINYLNLSFFIIGLSLILSMINQISVLPISWVIAGMVIGLAFMLLFIRTCYSQENALINVSLLKNKSFRLLISVRFIFMIFMSSSLFLMPLYLQNILSYSPFFAGLLLLAITLFVAISSPIVGKIMDKTGYAYPMVVSMVLACLSAIMMLAYKVHHPMPYIFASFILFGLAIGIHTPSSIKGVNASYPDKHAATAMGLFFTCAITGATFGVALAGQFISGLSLRFLNQSLISVTPHIISVANGTANIHTLINTKSQEVASMAFLHAYHIFSGVIIFLLGLSIILSLRLLKKPQNTNGIIGGPTRT